MCLEAETESSSIRSYLAPLTDGIPKNRPNGRKNAASAGVWSESWDANEKYMLFLIKIKMC